MANLVSGTRSIRVRLNMQPHPPRYINWEDNMCRIYETNKFHAVCSLHGEGLAEQLTRLKINSLLKALQALCIQPSVFTVSKYEHQR